MIAKNKPRREKAKELKFVVETTIKPNDDGLSGLITIVVDIKTERSLKPNHSLT